MRRADFGIFDVDTRQFRERGGWTYMPRALPYRDGIERLIAPLGQSRVPMIVTTCERGNMLPQDRFDAVHDDMLFIPLDSRRQDWTEKVADHDRFYVEKKFSRPDFPNDDPHSPYEIFLNNENANRLIRQLDIRKWIVFGNAMDVCGHLVIANFIAQDCRVHYIPELMIPGSACVDCNPDEFKGDVFDRWEAMDARPIPLDDVLGMIAGSPIPA